MIELTNVTMRYPRPKRYREYLASPFSRSYRTALDGVSLRVARGERVAVLGPNGAGKTTLLKLIGGLLLPTTGTVAVDGCDTWQHGAEVARQVGFVLNEERSFYWRLTGPQNLEFFAALCNLRRRDAHRRIAELLELVGLADAQDVRVSDYSCGMRQRLAIARGMLPDPNVLILDEPTKSLDPLGAEKLRGLIAEEIASKGGKTLIVATHQVAEAETLCDRVAILADQRVVAAPPMAQVKAGPGGLAEYYRDAAGPGQ